MYPRADVNNVDAIEEVIGVACGLAIWPLAEVALTPPLDKAKHFAPKVE